MIKIEDFDDFIDSILVYNKISGKDFLIKKIKKNEPYFNFYLNIYDQTSISKVTVIKSSSSSAEVSISINLMENCIFFELILKKIPENKKINEILSEYSKNNSKKPPFYADEIVSRIGGSFFNHYIFSFYDIKSFILLFNKCITKI